MMRRPLSGLGCGLANAGQKGKVALLPRSGSVGGALALREQHFPPMAQVFGDLRNWRIIERYFRVYLCQSQAKPVRQFNGCTRHDFWNTAKRADLGLATVGADGCCRAACLSATDHAGLAFLHSACVGDIVS